MGMKRFSIHDPKVKSYLSEWLFHELLKHEDLIAARYDFIKVAINGDKKGIFAIEEHFDKRLIENNKRREGLILKLDETNQVSSFKQQSEDQKRNFIMDYQKDSYSLSPFNTYNKVLEDKKLYDQFQLATSMFEAFRSNKLSTKDVFDLEQLAKLVALTDLLGERHNLKAKNIKFYFNPVTSRIEPIGYDQHLPTKYLNKLTGEHRTVLGETDTLDLLDQIFNDYNFYVLYVKYLHKYSEKSYLASIQAIDALALSADVPEWDATNTSQNKENILITHGRSSVQKIMSDYVGIVRSNRRLISAEKRLRIIYEETEELYKESLISVELCELRNLITTAYLICEFSRNRKENRGGFFNKDFVS